MALFISGKKGKCFYRCVNSDNLEVPLISFVFSMSPQRGVSVSQSISVRLRVDLEGSRNG